jgi:putative MATE family efflux protein
MFFFIGQLGSSQLAAASFTFPVVMVLFQVAIGIGIGVTSVISRMAGAHDERKARLLSTASLLLIVLIGLGLAAPGLLTVEPLFELMGATAELLPLIRVYMNFTYPALIFQMLTLVGSNVFRARGDTLRPSLVMVGSALVNTALDPLFIFGVGDWPGWGLMGAGVATLVGNALSFILVLMLLLRAHLLAPLRDCSWALIRDGVREIGRIGIPAALSNAVNPLAHSLITAIFAGFGAHAVAAYGVANRMQMFGMIPMLALSGVLSPFVGQNFGKHELARVRRSIHTSFGLCVIWCLVLGLVSFAAYPLAWAFTEEAAVVGVLAVYIQIVPLTLVGYGWAIMACSGLNATGQPIDALALVALRMLGLMVPMAYLGGYWWGATGPVWGIALANLVSGALAYLLSAYKLTQPALARLGVSEVSSG